MGDAIELTFADGSTCRIDVAAGEGDSTAADIRERKGDYSKGWLVDSHNARRTLNLATVVAIEVLPERGGAIS